MANGCNAFFRPFPAAGLKWIGSDIDIGSCAVLIREPGAIARGERSLQRDDALCRNGWTLPAKQESYRLSRSEATAEKADGNFIHSGTSCECDSAGL